MKSVTNRVPHYNSLYDLVDCMRLGANASMNLVLPDGQVIPGVHIRKIEMEDGSGRGFNVHFYTKDWYKRFEFVLAR